MFHWLMHLDRHRPQLPKSWKLLGQRRPGKSSWHWGNPSSLFQSFKIPSPSIQLQTCLREDHYWLASKSLQVCQHCCVWTQTFRLIWQATSNAYSPASSYALQHYMITMKIKTFASDVLAHDDSFTLSKIIAWSMIRIYQVVLCIACMHGIKDLPQHQ